jgi:DNA-binding cell septation regulator SpoVG
MDSANINDSLCAFAQSKNGSPPQQNAPIDLTGAAGNRHHRRRQPKLLKWTSYPSGAMLGFASVQLPSGMIVHDLRPMRGKNGHWVALPSQKQIDRDGRPRTDANGKEIWRALIEFCDRDTANKFRDQIIDLIKRAHPEALDGGGR